MSVDFDTNFDFQGSVNPATANLDYTPLSGILSWNDAELSTKTIVLTILDDGDIEPAERIGVQLFNISGAVLGPQYVGLVRLNDND